MALLDSDALFFGDLRILVPLPQNSNDPEGLPSEGQAAHQAAHNNNARNP